MKAKALYRLLSRVVVKADSGCWEWTGTVGKNGYGVFWLDGRNLGAHRASWALHGFGDAVDLCVLHRCDNRVCVNPAHLFLGTNAENMADMVAKGRAAGSRRIGERNPCARVTQADVQAIRAEYGAGSTQRAIAKRFGISQPTVNAIVSRKRWLHV